MLGITAQTRAAPRPGQPMPQQSYGAARFLIPVQQCEFQLTGILESLARDPWPVENDKRPMRCTGVALSVAVGLLEVSFMVSVTSTQHSNGRTDHVPQYWCTDYVVCWRPSHRGARNGCQQ